MNAHAPLKMSFEDYLAWEEAQREKHEYVDGGPALRRLRMMTGGTFRHAQVARNVIRHLANRLVGGPCQPIGSDFKVRGATGNSRYPDVTVECGAPDPKDLVADQPRVIIEVLSPSNDTFAQLRALEDYQSVAAAQCIVFLDQRKPSAKVWARDGAGWRDYWLEGGDAVLDLPSIGAQLSFAEIYDGVTFDAADAAPEAPA